MVSKTTGDPEGYADYNKHPELYRTDYIIETEDDLRQCMRKNVTEFPSPEDGPAVVGADEKAGGRELRLRHRRACRLAYHRDGRHRRYALTLP